MHIYAECPSGSPSGAECFSIKNSLPSGYTIKVSIPNTVWSDPDYDTLSIAPNENSASADSGDEVTIALVSNDDWKQWTYGTYDGHSYNYNSEGSLSVVISNGSGTITTCSLSNVAFDEGPQNRVYFNGYYNMDSEDCDNNSYYVQDDRINLDPGNLFVHN